ncbi:MAG: cyclase family protein, partial [Staphylococcus sp.]|nr:cyclase family protein [Staphylococcus sp.]
MEALEQKVKEDGVVIDEKILKVDGFLNHQIDAKLMYEVGQTFYKQFKDKGITKILTIEASGIAPAIMAALHFDVPCLFAKKAKPSTLKDGFYVQKFTVVGQYGTHIDAPIHFVEGGRWLDEIELKDLLLPL